MTNPQVAEERSRNSVDTDRNHGLGTQSIGDGGVNLDDARRAAAGMLSTTNDTAELTSQALSNRNNTEIRLTTFKTGQERTSSYVQGRFWNRQTITYKEVECKIKVPEGYTLYYSGKTYSTDGDGNANVWLRHGSSCNLYLRNNSDGSYKLYKVNTNEVQRENTDRDTNNRGAQQPNASAPKNMPSTSVTSNTSSNNVLETEKHTTTKSDVELPEITSYKVSSQGAYTLTKIKVPDGYTLCCGRTSYRKDKDGNVQVWLRNGADYNFYLCDNRNRIVRENEGRGQAKYYRVNTNTLTEDRVDLNSRAYVCEYAASNFGKITNSPNVPKDKDEKYVETYTKQKLEEDAYRTISEAWKSGKNPVFVSNFHGDVNWNTGTGYDSKWIAIIAEQAEKVKNDLNKEGVSFAEKPLVIAIHHCRSGITNEEMVAMENLPEGSVVIKSQNAEKAWSDKKYRGKVDATNCTVLDVVSSFSDMVKADNTLTIGIKQNGKVYYDSEDGHYIVNGEHNRFDFTVSNDRLRRQYPELCSDARTRTNVNRAYVHNFVDFVASENISNHIEGQTLRVQEAASNVSRQVVQQPTSVNSRQKWRRQALYPSTNQSGNHFATVSRQFGMLRI